MVTIQVIRERDGKPLQGAKVAAYYGLSNSKDGVADSRGEVHLEMNPQRATVVINGKSFKNQQLSGRRVFYI